MSAQLKLTDGKHPMTDVPYFAYGSNLNLGDWRRFCRKNRLDDSGIRPRQMAWLPDEAQAFNYHSESRSGGALSIQSQRGAIVEGYLFDVSPEGWAALDRKEGHPRHYRRETVPVIDANGSEIQAVTYRTAPEKRVSFVAPATEYLAICHAGREAFELSTSELDIAAANETRSTCNAIFVYGTLMRGEPRASTWIDSQVECALLAAAPGSLLDHGAYPGYVPSTDCDASKMVKGEFLRFKAIDDVLARFDEIEGFRGFGREGNLYCRTLVVADVGGGRGRLAWTYATARTSAPAITSGDWRTHRATKRVACTRILEGHVDAAADFLSRIAYVPDGPFGTQYPKAPTFDVILEDLVAGRVDERSLAQASGEWAVRWR